MRETRCEGVEARYYAAILVQPPKNMPGNVAPGINGPAKQPGQASFGFPDLPSLSHSVACNGAEHLVEYAPDRA